MARTYLLPGFRFHPTDVELVWYYLKRKIMGKPFQFEAISEVELYKFAPWDLPEKSCLKSKDLEWYFFCPRDKKFANGSRTNRATDIGFWKTTGRDRSVVHNSRTVGMKKTLVFHIGKAPRGSRTDWVMYEFRLEDEELANTGVAQDAYVLCKIFHKSGPGPKNGEQYGAPFNEDDWEDDSDTEHAVCFPSVHSSEPLGDQAIYVKPLQSVFEVGESSSMLDLSEAGEPSSMPRISEVGEPSSAPDLTYADGMLLEQLEELLNDSPMHSGNANNSEVQDSENGDLKEVSSAEVEGIFIGLDDLPDLLGLYPHDGIRNLSKIDCDYSMDPALLEFADEHYLELGDFSFLSGLNLFELFGCPNDMHYPFINHLNFQGLNNISADGMLTPMASNRPLPGPDLITGQLQPTLEVPGLHLTPQWKYHLP